MNKTTASRLSKSHHLDPDQDSMEPQRTTKQDWDTKIESGRKKKTLCDATSRTQYYKTHAGHWKQRDEPDEDEQDRQADRINQMMRAQRQKASRERLRRKHGGVTTRKDGRKLFDEFMVEATKYKVSRPQVLLTRKGSDDLKNAYHAALSLEFDQWAVLMNDLFKGKI